MDIEERLESPTISKKSVIPHATVMVAPYKDGFVSSFQYYGGGKSQLNISTPLDLQNIYPTRQEAIDVAHTHGTGGDIVLLSPATDSHASFKSFEDRGNQFIACVQKLKN